jgi:hypothetical protein
VALKSAAIRVIWVALGSVAIRVICGAPEIRGNSRDPRWP